MSEALETSVIEVEGDQTVEEYARVCDQRASTYSLLARLYKKEVDQAFLDFLLTVRFPVASGNEDIDEGYRRIATYLSKKLDDPILSLAIDYCRSFLGSGNTGHSAAYPFESAYTSEKRLLMQDARDEVLAIYRSAGLEKRAEWREGEDHLALEFEYMQVLCERAAQCLREGNVDGAMALLFNQYNFLEDHILVWVPVMLEDLKKFAKTDFYQGLAYLTGGYLKVEEDYLYELFEDDAAN